MEIGAALPLPDGSMLALDTHGHLAEWQQWTPEVAGLLAAVEGLALGPNQRTVLMVLREFYAEFGICPPMRALVKLTRAQTGNADLSSRELYQWFPGGPMRQGSRLAGLPLPPSCI